MPLPIIRYALDKTGINASNYVAGEVHALASFPKRAVALTYGAYFTESLFVYDNADNRLLVRHVDYDCVELLPTPTSLYGKEICYLILITNPAVSANVRVNYQALGGDYNNVPESLVNMYNLIEATIAGGNVAWPNIIAKPATFAPEPHPHTLDDLIGFEFMTTALEAIRQAILMADAPAHEAVLKYVDGVLASYYQTVNIRLDTVAAPAISAVSGNALIRYSDGLYVPVAAPSPSPSPTPAPGVTADYTGAVIGFAFNAIPTGFIKANGATVSRTTYAALFAKIGETYGAGDGSTTFKLPDYRGIFLRGYDDGRGVDASRVFGLEQLDAFKSHSHTLGVTIQSYGSPGLGSGVYTQISNSETSLAGDTETRPRNNTLLFCIRY